MQIYRIIAIFLVTAVGALATGVPGYFHEREHDREDAAELAAFVATHGPLPANTPIPHKEHDETNCPMCALLRAPMILIRSHFVLVDSGAVVYQFAMTAIHQHSYTLPSRLACRGPPDRQFDAFIG